MASKFVSLPPEIHARVARFSGKADIVLLMCSSRAVYTLYVEILYRDVDLSMHHRQDYCKAMDQMQSKIPRYPLSGSKDDRLEAFRMFMPLHCKRQSRFIQTLLQHSELTTKVQVLKWTIVEPQRAFKGVHLLSNGEAGLHISGLWDVLGSMANVVEVEMGHAAVLGGSCRLYGMPQQLRLFHRATSITLVGYMNTQLATAILSSSDPKCLKHLHLHHLRAFDHNIIEHGVKGDLKSYPHPPRNALTALGARKNLQTLEIRENGHLWNREALAANEKTLERKLYGDMHVVYGKIIEAAKPSLKIFTYATNTEDERYWHGGATHRLTYETQYWKHVNPVLMKGPWPELERIQLPGLDRRDEDPKTWASDFLKGVGPRDKHPKGPEVHIMGDYFKWEKGYVVTRDSIVDPTAATSSSVDPQQAYQQPEANEAAAAAILAVARSHPPDGSLHPPDGSL